MTSTDHTTSPAAGSFMGIDVRTGRGGGLASSIPIAASATTSYHAARLPQLGDTVLAVVRVFDADTAAPLHLQLRAFAASAPARGAITQLDEAVLAETPGVIAFATIGLSESGYSADERHPARLTRCVVTDAAPTAAVAHSVADWLRSTWETELAFGSWPAIIGTLDAFGTDSATAEWARTWLEDSEHHVAAGDSATFLKVLSPAWLEHDSGAEAATDDV